MTPGLELILHLNSMSLQLSVDERDSRESKSVATFHMNVQIDCSVPNIFRSYLLPEAETTFSSLL